MRVEEQLKDQDQDQDQDQEKKTQEDTVACHRGVGVIKGPRERTPRGAELSKLKARELWFVPRHGERTKLEKDQESSSELGGTGKFRGRLIRNY